MAASDAGSSPEVGAEGAPVEGGGLEDGLVCKLPALVLRFEDESGADGLEVEPWVLERFEYFRRLVAGGFSEAERGEAKLPCRRGVFEAFLMLSRGLWAPACIDLMTRMEVLRIADMLSEADVVRELADSIRADYLADGDGARDSAVMVLCELADLLAPAGLPDAVASSVQGPGQAPSSPSPAAVWLVATTAVAPAPVSSVPAGPVAGGEREGQGSETEDPLGELRQGCLAALPPWIRQRFAEKPQVWRLRLSDVLDVYGAEASPRTESSWLALHAARRFSTDILPFASVESEEAARLIQENPEMVIKRCISLCVRELPFSKSVHGFGGIVYQIQVALHPGQGGGWVLGVGGQGLCALRRVTMEIEGRPGGERHELGFTGFDPQASPLGERHADSVLGFASGVHHTPLPFSVRLTICEYPLHLAVQTYVGLNFSTMALLSQGFDFGPMDLACVTDLWLQSDQLRRVPEDSVAEVVRRTLRFVKLEWAPVVRVSFIVCMHSFWAQAKHKWWHTSLITSCRDLEVWSGPAQGRPGAGTFRSYVVQIVQQALSHHPDMFTAALHDFVEGLPPFTLAAIEDFFAVPDSISDPMSIVARHYLQVLRAESERLNGSRRAPVWPPSDGAQGAAASAPGKSPAQPSSLEAQGAGGVGVPELADLLQGFWRLVGPPLEQADPRTAMLAFAALAALCDLRHQRRMCAESLQGLRLLEGRAPDGPEARFWAACFFTLLEFSSTMKGAAARGAEGAVR